MNDPQKRIISLTTALTVGLSLIIVVAFPISYFLTNYHNLNDVMEAHAESRAIFANQIIFANPDLWVFETIRLEHFLSQQTTSGASEEQRIIDQKGQVVAQKGVPLLRPVHTVSYPLRESGRVVGYLQISRSLRPLIEDSLLVGFFCLLLGLALFFTLNFYPLRALGQSLTLLNQERQRFQVIFESSLMAVALLDRDCAIVEVNHTFADLTLTTPADLKGRTFLDLVSLAPEQDLRSLFRELVEEKRESFHREMRYRSGNVGIKWGDLSVFVLEQARADEISFFAMFNDITERKRAEAALEESEAKYRALVETSYDWIWEVDAQCRYTYAAPKVKEILGYTPEEMLGRTPFEFMPAAEAERIRSAFTAIAEARQPFAALENINLHRDGRQIILETSGVPFFDAAGSFAGYRGTDRDVTARKQGEAALEAEATRRRILMEHSSDGIVILDQNGKVYEANLKYAEMLGYSPEEVRQLHVWDWDAQWNREELLEMVRTIDDAGDHFETRHRRKDGTVFDVEISTNGAVVSGHKLIFCVCRDITARKQAEEALSRQHRELQETARQLEYSKNMLQLILESIPVRVFWKDTNLHYLGCNPQFAHDAGFKQPQDLVGKDDYAMAWKENADKYRGDDRDVIESGRPKLNLIEPQTTPAGRQITLNTSKVPLKMPNGEILGVLGVYEDITEKKRAEDEIQRQRDQLRALAARLSKIQEIERQQLALELHDQICQSLTTIDLTLENLKMKVQKEPVERLLPTLADLSALIEQTNEIARDIMEGLRPTVLEHYGLTGALRGLRGQFRQRTGIALEIREETPIPRLKAPVELALFRIVQEALANVSKHARARKVILTLTAKAGLVRLSIADDGIGFDSKQVVQLRGRYGWGLVTMNERAMAVGGECRVESQPGHGTRVEVEVPMDSEFAGLPTGVAASKGPDYQEP